MSKAAAVTWWAVGLGSSKRAYRVVFSTVVSARGPYFVEGKGILHAVSTPEAQAGEIAPVLVASPEYPTVGIEANERCLSGVEGDDVSQLMPKTAVMATADSSTARRTVVARLFGRGRGGPGRGTVRAALSESVSPSWAGTPVPV